MSSDKPENETVRLAVVTEKNYAQCLYIDGKRWASPGENTVYACDLFQAANGRLIDFAWLDLEWEVDDWPETVEEAILQPLKIHDEQENSDER